MILYFKHSTDVEIIYRYLNSLNNQKQIKSIFWLKLFRRKMQFVFPSISGIQKELLGSKCRVPSSIWWIFRQPPFSFKGNYCRWWDWLWFCRSCIEHSCHFQWILQNHEQKNAGEVFLIQLNLCSRKHALLGGFHGVANSRLISERLFYL